ncbi:MAG: hypothetical protein IPJ65_10055 [Archangiaceae bacterium]|nr:hypothetical protein [Archangiaceae bacterium]
MAVRKISVSLEADEVAWLQKRARQQRKTVSGLLAEATRLLRQLAARKQLIEEMGEMAKLTPARIKEIEREWKG